jgi:hypothetical protein
MRAKVGSDGNNNDGGHWDRRGEGGGGSIDVKAEALHHHLEGGRERGISSCADVVVVPVLWPWTWFGRPHVQ